MPVTIITGFLGAGKTTLLRHVLSEPHGLKIAVIQNELSATAGLEASTVRGPNGECFDDWVELANGCVCCEVREELAKGIERLMELKGAFDYVLVETTGMADPVPIVRTLRQTIGELEGYTIDLEAQIGALEAQIDAANEHDKLLELCRALDVRSVLETHGHFDHIQAVPAVREAGYRVAVTADDAAMLPSYDDLLEDETVLEVGRLRLHTICTPGHTPGSICFRLEGSPILFSGDTLFPGGPGNTTFEGGDFSTIIGSIDRRLFSPLPPETVVMPGHGVDTTIGAEQPKLDEWVDRGW